MGRSTRAAVAGILVTLAIQGIGMLFRSNWGRCEGRKPCLAELAKSLVRAIFVHLAHIQSRRADGGFVVRLPVGRFANAGYFVAGAKLLELIFKRALRKLENDEAGLTQSSAS